MRKVEGLLKCRCGARMVFYRDNDDVLHFMEVTKDKDGRYVPVEEG